MAWISIHEQLKDHKKIRLLTKLLGCNRHEAIGILTCFWLWCLDNCDDTGLIEYADADDIATGTMYRGESKKLLSSLITSGWVNEIEDSLLVNDWSEWQKDWIQYKKKKAYDNEYQKSKNKSSQSEKRNENKTNNEIVSYKNRNENRTSIVENSYTTHTPRNNQEYNQEENIKHTQEEKTKAQAPDVLLGKSDAFKIAFHDFREHRKKLRKPMTLRAEEMIVRQLEKLSLDENEQIEIIQASIVNGWQGVFPLKKDHHYGKFKQNFSPQQNSREVKAHNEFPEPDFDLPVIC